MTYHILKDLGSEGYSLGDIEYETIDNAVKDAVKNNYSYDFLIIQIIDWEAKEKTI